MKKLFFWIVVIMMVGMWNETCNAEGKQVQYVIALDPGHGGEEDGAEYNGLKEQDLNYKLAVAVKEGLETYQGVKVILTRQDGEDVSLSERARRAKEEHANILISLHFNASVSHNMNGASIFISTGERYRQELKDFADCFLGEFEAIGLVNAGTFARVTQLGIRRTDGSFDDYYGVIRHSYNYGMPALIVEHCFLDSEKDSSYYMTPEGLHLLAKADINGIAGYYGLLDQNGTVAKEKHAKGYGQTTKGIDLNCDSAPNIINIELLSGDMRPSSILEYQVEVQDIVGVSSVYLVYQNVVTLEKFTMPLLFPKPMKTGINKVNGYIPKNIVAGKYQLCFVGAYNVAGYDAGYNYYGNQMIGFGKCDWLNQFLYQGQADLEIQENGIIDERMWLPVVYSYTGDLLDKWKWEKEKILPIASQAQ